MRKNIIVTGCKMPDDWELRKGIEEGSGNKWDVETCITCDFHGINKITRYIKYFLFPLKYFIFKDKYERIISYDQFFGLVLSFYYSIFRIKKTPEIYVMAFIYKNKKSVAGNIYYRFIKRCIGSGYINKIFIFGNHKEADYYSGLFGMPKESFIPLVLGVRDSSEKFPNKTWEGEKYYLSAGRSNRDYKFLKKNWPKDHPSLYILCDTEKENTVNNIIIKNNCFEDNYLRMIARSYAVIISLDDKEISSGQLVCVHAAMMGKPVIVTDNNAIKDYVIDGKTGFIIKKTADSLIAALNKLNDPEIYNSMSLSARKLYEKKFSSKNLGRIIGGKICERQKMQNLKI